MKQLPDGRWVNDDGTPADRGQMVMGGQGGNASEPTISKNLSPATPPVEAAPVAAPGVGMAVPAFDGAPMPINPPAAPGKHSTMETTGSTTTSGSTRVVESDQSKADRAQLATDMQASETVSRRQGVANAERAQTESDLARYAQLEAERLQREEQKVRAEANARYEAAKAEALERQKEYNNAKPQHIFEGDGKAYRGFMAGLATILGGMGQAASARGGVQTDNKGFAAVQDSIKAWDAREQQRIAKLRDVATQAKDNIGLTLGERDRAIMDHAQKTAGIWNQFSLMKARHMASLGIPQAQIDADKDIVTARKQHDQILLNLDQALNKHVTSQTITTKQVKEGDITGAGAGGAGGKISDGMRERTALFNSVLPDIQTMLKSGGLSKDAVKTIWQDKKNEKLLESAPAADALTGALGLQKTLEQKLKPQDKATWAAYQNMLDVANKYITGAGQTDKEFQRRFNKFVAQPGDDATSASAKVRGLARMLYEYGAQGADPAGAAAGMQAAVAGASQGARAAPKPPPELVQMARERLKKNPNDADAQRLVALAGG